MWLLPVASPWFDDWEFDGVKVVAGLEMLGREE
jgi:hypothetical protein